MKKSTVHQPHPDISPRIRFDGSDAGAAGRGLENLDLLAVRVNPGQPLTGPDPEKALRIQGQDPDLLSGQKRVFRKRRRSPEAESSRQRPRLLVPTQISFSLPFTNAVTRS